MNLLELQRRFKQVVDQGQDAVALPITEPPKGYRATRIATYSYAVWARQTQALLEDFPSIAEALGEDEAEKLAREYLTVHPSRYASLSELGRDFAGWLDRHPVHAPLAPEAELEWLEVVADRAAEPKVDESVKNFGATLVGLGEEGFLAATMVLHPSVQLCGPQRMLVYRSGEDLCREELSETQLRLLEGMRLGVQVASLLEWLGDADGVAVDEEAQQQEMMNWFENWVREGVIMGVLAAPTTGEQ